MKYRIIEYQEDGVAESFEPQFNPFFFWRSWRDNVGSSYEGTLRFSSYERAFNFIRVESDTYNTKRKKENSKKEIIHKLY